MQLVKHIRVPRGNYIEHGDLKIGDFVGELVYVRNELPIVAKCKATGEYAVLSDIDGWVSPTIYSYAIIDLGESKIVDELIEQFNDGQLINGLEAYYTALCDVFKEYEVGNTSVASGPNTETFRASKSGKLSISVNDKHRDKKIIVGMRIGGAIELEHAKVILAFAQLGTSIGEPYFLKHYNHTYAETTHGTNFDQAFIGKSFYS